jgi:hypothetical protein
MPLNTHCVWGFFMVVELARASTLGGSRYRSMRSTRRGENRRREDDQVEYQSSVEAESEECRGADEGGEGEVTTTLTAYSLLA